MSKTFFLSESTVNNYLISSKASSKKLEIRTKSKGIGKTFKIGTKLIVIVSAMNVYLTRLSSGVGIIKSLVSVG